jgi:ERF superfamily
LGEQAIATLQTTTIDQDIQSVSLTTVLAHASGEWIASDWPVCALSDMAVPRRMGAALTYARRYALFTLVGIAGEDDLDAPDLGGQSAETTTERGNGHDAKRQNRNGADQPLGRFTASRKPWSPPKQPLEPGKSAALRDRLLGEIGALASEEQATAWAHKAMDAKNTLTTADCGVVEASFAARLAELTDRSEDAKSGAPVDHGPPDAEAITVENGAVPRSPTPADPEALAAGFGPPRRVNNAVAWHVDKGALALSEPRRYRDRAHLRLVSAQPCLICGRRPSDAHHLRFAQPRALGRRVSDEYTVPLCRSHHRALHRWGDEAGWWKTNGVDPIAVAGELWQRTRLDGLRGERIGALLSVGVIEAPGSAGQ